MVLRVAFQMDDITSINIETDSTFAIAFEAQKRGYEIYYYSPESLGLENHHTVAYMQPIKLHNDPKDFVSFLAPPVQTNLSDMDVIWLRQDPPFDMRYITSTYFLERVTANTLVVNHPTHVRNCPEKLFTHYFSEFMPDTLVSENHVHIQEFYKKHQDIIIKPLYGCGGEGIVRFTGNADALDSLIETYRHSYQCALVFQAFIPNVTQGDKRIILVDGKAVGAVLRIPPEGQIQANFHQGGVAAKTTLTENEHAICEALGPVLRDKGLLFVGIDIIDGYLTEINVTSPTGIHEINHFDKTCIEALIWDALETKLNATHMMDLEIL